jgi:hypothetical protein
MRMMLRAQLEVDAANLAIADGSIGPTLDKLFSYCRPEATYFLVENGNRTIYAVFDMASANQVPVIAETLFHAFGATVDLHPVMVAAELEEGLKGWADGRG